MCAIAGIAGNTARSEIVRQALEASEHRGPDHRQVWESQRVVLGHNRLAIIGLNPEANQPMVDTRAGLCITFNGEIYNWEELRAELCEEFEPVTQRSDTEVILMAYRKWGRDFVNHLDGMFAFALYDQTREELILARDRFGEKPLFYTRLDDGSLAFASEVKALVRSGIVTPEVNTDTLYHYLTMLTPEPGQSFFKAVRKLEAGHTLVLDMAQQEPAATIQAYWDIAEVLNTQEAATFEDILARGDEGVRDSVITRSRADAGLAVALSAGLDSSLIATLSQATRPPGSTNGIHVNAVDGEARFVEKDVVTQFAQDLDINLLLESVTVDAYMEAFHELSAWLLDCPVIYPHMVLVWILARTLSEKDIKVLLLGDGGDELGAYRSYFKALDQFNTFESDPDTPDAVIRQCVYKGELISRRHCHFMREPVKEKFWRGPTPARETYDIMQAYMNEIDIPGEEGFARKILNLEYKVRIPELITPIADYAAMAHGVEARNPLLAHGLIASLLPTPFRVRNHGRLPKAWIYKLGEKYLPGYLTEQPKRGFGRDFWAPVSARLTQMCEAELLEKPARITDFIEKKFIQKTIEKQKLKGTLMSQLFILYAIEKWLANVASLQDSTHSRPV
ncbi:asparagine synthase (glutamine-hydrolyzing) [Henriciella sp.]|uniref:asparagine synthase (glutamine-hydrolyzing) n=1 Tax=Henriciella sp. TaxID=1968823 RepID=UPI0026305417|nr:asparagine synthase (glutamine-hydrolyzing) [Henriciella sp.]